MPNNQEAEQAILGAMLASPEHARKAVEELKPDDFFWDNNREIFNALVTLSDDLVPLDMVTLVNELSKRGTFEIVGGLEYISTIMDIVPVKANIDNYIDILHEKTTYRQLISLSQDIMNQTYEGDQEPQQLIDAAEKKIFSIAMNRGVKDYREFTDVMFDAYMDIERIALHKGQIIGVPSGFDDLDAVTAGFQKTDLIIVAARPAMGKTSLALSMAYNIAARSKMPVGMFSLEMSASQLVQRIISMEANIPLQKIRGGNMNDDEWMKLQDAVRALTDIPIYIDDSSLVTTAEIRSKARKMKIEHNVQAIFIDYLQFITGNSKLGSKQLEVAEISRDLKSLAKELEIPIICLAQLGRGPDARTDHRPVLSDLRDSGAIEQDADIVCFIYRDEYYNSNTEKPGIGELILAKHRNGATSTVEVAWLAEYTRYDNKKKD
ncbi:MAG: replicative DNA helicase [Clostridiales bacterium]|nr:replicative DNA helicase [Clostridiales bacterium]